LYKVTAIRPFQKAAVIAVFAAVGMLTFLLTAVFSGESILPAWSSHGLSGVILWAYERGSLATVIVVFILSLVCAWIPISHRLLAAISLSLFYPSYAFVRLLLGTHSGNLLPFEFLGYVFFTGVCVLGYSVGRLLTWGKRNVRSSE
jgi:hypothetical protein